MSKSTVQFESSDNFSFKSNLVQITLESRMLTPWKSIVGQPQSTLFVFDAKTKGLLYKLEPDDQITGKERRPNLFKFVKYSIFAVSEQYKTLRIETDLLLSDATIKNIFLDIQISTDNYENVAIAIMNDGDPVRDLCNSIKKQLDSALLILNLSTVDLEDGDSIKKIVDGVNNIIENIQVDHPYITLDKIFAQDIFKSIADARITAQKIAEEEEQRRREMQEKIAEEELRKLELQKMTDPETALQSINQKYNADLLEKNNALKINEIELIRLGIDDPRIRLIMGNPDIRNRFLESLYEKQVAMLQQSQDHAKEIHQLQVSAIQTYLNKVLDELSSIEHLEQFLNLTKQYIVDTPKAFMDYAIPDSSSKKINSTLSVKPTAELDTQPSA